jgi:hypothetical protein
MVKMQALRLKIATAGAAPGGDKKSPITTKIVKMLASIQGFSRGARVTSISGIKYSSQTAYPNGVSQSSAKIAMVKAPIKTVTDTPEPRFKFLMSPLAFDLNMVFDSAKQLVEHSTDIPQSLSSVSTFLRLSTVVVIYPT